MKKSLAMAVAACAMLAANAATNITGSVSLSADADWTEFGLVTVESGATLDLNGNTLTVAGIGGQGSIVSSFANIATDTSKASSTNEFASDTVVGNAFQWDSRVLVAKANWPLEIVYDFGEATLVDSYSIVNWNNNYASNRAPGVWTIYGSADNDSWTQLDSQTNVTNWPYGETNSYSFVNSTKYQYYKISASTSAYPTATQGGYIQFRQLQYGRKGGYGGRDGGGFDGHNWADYCQQCGCGSFFFDDAFRRLRPERICNLHCGGRRNDRLVRARFNREQPFRQGHDNGHTRHCRPHWIGNCIVA